jgi:hypothetical protein
MQERPGWRKALDIVLGIGMPIILCAVVSNWLLANVDLPGASRPATSDASWRRTPELVAAQNYARELGFADDRWSSESGRSVAGLGSTVRYSLVFTTSLSGSQLHDKMLMNGCRDFSETRQLSTVLRRRAEVSLSEEDDLATVSYFCAVQDATVHAWMLTQRRGGRVMIDGEPVVMSNMIELTTDIVLRR